MKSFFSKILVLTLLTFTASVSVARETAPAAPTGCWFDTTKNSEGDYGNADQYVNNYCAVPFTSTDYYIGKVIANDGKPECYYNIPEGDGLYDLDVRWLNTHYDALKDIIKEYGKQGNFHESFNDFHKRFPDCTPSTQGHTPVVSNNDKQASTPSYQEICLSDENVSDNKRGIKIGYWQNGDCKTENAPYYLEEKPEQPKGEDGCPIYKPDNEFSYDEQPKGEDGCPIYDPNNEFSCGGYEFYRRGWAEECLSGFGRKVCYESTTCKKSRTKKECCDFAKENKCETVSMDTKGHCCCGLRLNKDNDKCRNVGLRQE